MPLFVWFYCANYDLSSPLVHHGAPQPVMVYLYHIKYPPYPQHIPIISPLEATQESLKTCTRSVSAYRVSRNLESVFSALLWLRAFLKQ
jgi:hypothetical protein